MAKTYDTYKDSGIAWIPTIPQSWQVKRLKDVGFLYGGLTGKSGEDFNVKDNDESYMLFIPFTNIFNNSTINPNQLYKVKVVEGENQNLVYKNDLLFLMSSEDYDGVGKPAIMEVYIENVGLNSFCKGFRITDNQTFPKFLFYFLSSHFSREQVRQEAKGFIRINLRQDKLSCCDLLLPQLSEQQSIATFLDTKCGEIDTLISLQEEMISELQAYKQSVITEAVTKGLNPHAKMKDSGVEWIGEIPEGWKVCKTSRLYEIQLGKMLQPSQQNDEDILCNYLCAANVSKNTLKLESIKQMWMSPSERQQYAVKKGDLLVVEGGDVASCAIIEDDIDNCYIQNALHRVRPKKDNGVRFLKYCLNAVKNSGHIDFICNRATIAHFTKEKFANLTIPVPPLSEQHSIATYLDEKTSQIDSLISLKQEKIQELKDYKKSIIYEYVTGKKRV